jgi:uncharacterized membrane protein YeaQ/YmgE (transglycosylase-associated protein family)
MKKWKIIVSVILVFLLGALAGALVIHKVDQHRIAGIIRGEPGAVGELIVQRLNHKLRLDPQQVEKVRVIVYETHDEIRNVRKQFRPQIQEILDRSRNRVRAILRPDQLEEYEKIVAERKARQEREESSR